MVARALSREEVRDIDRRAIEEYGMPGLILMENAGRGAAELMIELGIDGPVVICAGKGNNGGDGFVIARHLENHGRSVRVLLFCEKAELKGDAAINFRVIESSGTPISVLGSRPDIEAVDGELAAADWIVDAMLGTGTHGAVREPYATVIDRINQSSGRVLAVDLPSGLDCDTGQPLGPCVEADHTATFVARKLGFDVRGSDRWTGVVHVIDIGVPRIMLEK